MSLVSSLLCTAVATAFCTAPELQYSPGVRRLPPRAVLASGDTSLGIETTRSQCTLSYADAMEKVFLRPASTGRSVPAVELAAELSAPFQLVIHGSQSRPTTEHLRPPQRSCVN